MIEISFSSVVREGGLQCDRSLDQVSLGTPVSSTGKPDRHDIAKILLKVALNTITPYPN
jgi:hypothetical protein